MIPVWLLENEESVVNEHGVFISGGKTAFIHKHGKHTEIEIIVFKYGPNYYASLHLMTGGPHYSGVGLPASITHPYKSYYVAVEQQIKYGKHWLKRNFPRHNLDNQKEYLKINTLLDNLLNRK